MHHNNSNTKNDSAYYSNNVKMNVNSTKNSKNHYKNVNSKMDTHTILPLINKKHINNGDISNNWDDWYLNVSKLYLNYINLSFEEIMITDFIRLKQVI